MLRLKPKLELICRIPLAAAVGSVALMAPCARAQEMLELKLHGFTTGYAVHSRQDEPAGVRYRPLDLRRSTELVLSADMKVEGGPVVGVSMELLGDRFDANQVQESYLHVSGEWGRVNLGEEDGIAYLLQVTAPSGDDRIDGARPKIGAFSTATLGGTIRYGHNDFGRTNKLTYMTPVVDGFQAGASFTPSPSEGDRDGESAAAIGNTAGTHLENGWELAARYTHDIQAVRLTLGSGYSRAAQEVREVGEDDRERFNVGMTLSWRDFQAGTSFGVTNNAAGDNDTETSVIGVRYAIEPCFVGASYLNQTNENATFDEEIDRWTAGLVYAAGSGLTFRGAYQYQAAENLGGIDTADHDGSLFAIGSQLTF